MRIKGVSGTSNTTLFFFAMQNFEDPYLFLCFHQIDQTYSDNEGRFTKQNT